MTAPQPDAFWYPLLDVMDPPKRRDVIFEALRCGVISGAQAKEFVESWPGEEGFEDD